MKRGAIISILLHLGLVSLLFIGFFEYFKGTDSSNPEAEIIEAYSVDASTLNNNSKTESKVPVKHTKQIDKIQMAQRLKEKLEIQKQKKLAQEKKLQAEISLQEEKKKRLEQEAKLKELELKKKQQDDLRKKRLEQKRLQAKKQKKLKQEQEAKKQEKLKQEQEAKKAKLAEEERLAATRRKEELAAGQAKERALTNSIISKYSTLIKQKMEKNWRRPADTRNLVCTTKIKLLPDGSVFDVKIIKSSGSSSFDGSVIDALYNAGTFPLPDQPKYRALFVDDDLTMRFTNKTYQQ